MATVILVRHGRTTANATGVLAGRTAGVALDAVGRGQAARTGERLSVVPLAAVVTSPLERCRQTARAITSAAHDAAVAAAAGAAAADAAAPPDGASRPEILVPPTLVDRRLTECDYGEWQGRKLVDLAKEPLWSTVQSRPSAVTFPGGESMSGMQARAVAAVREHDAAVEREYGAGAVWVAVSHGDVIKSIIADAYGMHLDLFQRITVGPASVSIIRYGTDRTEVVSTNTDAGDLSWLRAVPPAEQATVGGGAGH